MNPPAKGAGIIESWIDNNENGFWDDSEPFIDELNGNGLHNEYDGGPRPRPPFYGLPFNLGPDNQWQKYLSKDIQNKIENAFKNEMKELGYI